MWVLRVAHIHRSLFAVFVPAAGDSAVSHSEAQDRHESPCDASDGRGGDRPNRKAELRKETREREDGLAAAVLALCPARPHVKARG